MQGAAVHGNMAAGNGEASMEARASL